MDAAEPGASGGRAPRGARDDAGAVRSAVLSLHRTTGLPMVFGGALSGRDRLCITELVGNTTDSLNGLVVRQGNGLGGKAMALGRPAWVSNYPCAASISHDYDKPVGREGLLSIVAVPIVVRRRVRGVLYGALREPLGLADRIVGAAVQVARDLEQDLAVQDRADEALARAGSGAPAAPGTSAARWEEVRAVHAELRALAEEVSDLPTRDRLRRASLRLAAAGPGDGAGLDDADAAPRPALSPRELDVLSYVAIGCTNAEAAERLGLLPETVKSYLRSAMRKLDSHTRLEAVTAARRAGLLP
ncbi:GAF modulated transcriptional regulator, LuxR family [Actinomadura meyerae]|jgi:DNA-binding CsgD family transcriptional regulator|uniref:GAF modulated transcriptional regulator, LuxR family n=1 Tax=Actinomadura meyerae TaxID=240840 RepID=A0A239M3G8_9ACTN|nr:helix-turn-helix transcriptional regulator [Actinomadura meyerae]SNT36469.1 GAF modulated transcriptional regulator, LuxR family [Actinomadura meyerae]